MTSLCLAFECASFSSNYFAIGLFINEVKSFKVLVANGFETTFFLVSLFHRNCELMN